MAEIMVTTEAGSQVSGSVCLNGQIQAKRKLGNLIFLVVRDRAGTIQVVVEEAAALAVAECLALESAVEIIGDVVAHPEKSGVVEVQAKAITVLSTPVASLPVEISKNKKVDALALNTLLEHRPVTLRNEKVRAIFKVEAALCAGFRSFLNARQFTEIHSPKIVATGTEGGAQLFKLKYFEKEAFLAQSPQFYKQIMVGALERVYEIGPVYRAEEHDTTRHLNEYISMDVEMGFIRSEQDLIALETALVRSMFEYVTESCGRELELYGVQLPQIAEIPQLKLEEAIRLLRNECGWKTVGEDTDLDPDAERLLCEHFARTENCEFVFVTHYPHAVRPFYAMPETGTAASHSFDLLFRGLEITTGGQRIHQHEMLCDSIASRGLEPEMFSDYLQCFKYGMPPHGGFALGLERVAKQILGLANVKQAALFPRDRNRLTP